jgi:hypothetical protein
MQIAIINNFQMMKFLILFLLCACGKPSTKEKVLAQTNPLTGVSEELILGTDISFNFDLLPLSGKVKKNKKLWSGDTWRLKRGAINYRWYAEEKTGFNYSSPNERQLQNYPTTEMKALSPSEKYDIYMGRYDYPLKAEVDWLARSGLMDWEGLCHGWAGASLNHDEPGAKTLKNPDGITVYFGASDVKALLTYAYSKLILPPTATLGRRCEVTALLEVEDNCDDDLSALTFHAVLASKMGLRGQSFIADMDRYKEVWNHPILSYESSVIKMNNYHQGRKAIITTKLTYIDVTEKDSWERDTPQMLSYMTMKYELELDAKGNMINSRWLSRERPDFIWTVSRAEQFDGYLSGVINLLD